MAAAIVRAVYDARSADACEHAAALQDSAPADFTVSLAPLGRATEAASALGPLPPEIIVLLGDFRKIPVRRMRAALRQRGWTSKLVVGWSASLPHGIGALQDLYREADAWMLADRLYWETFGRMPGTWAIASGGDLDVFAARAFRRFRDVLNGRRPRPRRRDLTTEVTVFVTTVGAPTFEACLERLSLQTCTFTMQIIAHTAPMNVAFQRMLDECRTPFYVQVDEDMLLYPDAVRRLYELISGAPANVAMAARDLYDAHLGRCINGVKIFRHAIVRRYPFESRDSFETSQLARMEHDGHTVLRTPFDEAPVAGRTLGLHGVRWTPQTVFERYLHLGRRRRLSDIPWLEAIPNLFLRRFLDEPSAENFFALQGFLVGTLAARHGEAAAKDYRAYGRLPGFHHLAALLDEIGAAPPARAAPPPVSARTGTAGRSRRARSGRPYAATYSRPPVRRAWAAHRARRRSDRMRTSTPRPVRRRRPGPPRRRSRPPHPRPRPAPHSTDRR
jgi:hypothetical protein